VESEGATKSTFRRSCNRSGLLPTLLLQVDVFSLKPRLQGRYVFERLSVRNGDGSLIGEHPKPGKSFFIDRFAAKERQYSENVSREMSGCPAKLRMPSRSAQSGRAIH